MERLDDLKHNGLMLYQDSDCPRFSADALLLCGFLSLGMLLVGLVSRRAPMAVRVAFMAALFLALAGGLIVPSAFLPQAVRDVCYYSPFAAALRLCIAGLFDHRATGIGVYSLLLLGYIALLLPVALGLFQRRSH